MLLFSVYLISLALVLFFTGSRLLFLVSFCLELVSLSVLFFYALSCSPEMFVSSAVLLVASSIGYLLIVVGCMLASSEKLSCSFNL